MAATEETVLPDPPVKGILKKGDDLKKKKKSGHLKIDDPGAVVEHKPHSDIILVETATGIVKKDAAGNILEDRREKPRGERQQIRPKKSSSGSLHNDTIAPPKSSSAAASPSDDVIAFDPDLLPGASDDIIPPSPASSPASAPSPSPTSTSPAPAPETSSASEPSTPTHSDSSSSAGDKEKCIIC